MSNFQLPYTWTTPQLRGYLKIMFCSEVRFDTITQDGIDYLHDWASMCSDFQMLAYQDLFAEFSVEMKKDESLFFQSCLRESLQLNYSQEQKVFIVQGLLNAPEHLMQLYFTFLLHDCFFTNVESGCYLNVDMRFHQLANIGAPFHRIPKNLALPEMHLQNIQNFQEYLSRICDHWMNHGDFTLGISSVAENK